MQKPCSACGALNRPQANVCAICGHALSSATSPAVVQPSSPTVMMSQDQAPHLRTSQGQVFPLLALAVVVGREACDITLNDGRVSRRHASIEQAASGWQIVDLGSSNGTYVNGQPLPSNQPHPLMPGDEIVVGGTTMWFESAASAAGGSAPLSLPPTSQFPGPFPPAKPGPHTPAGTPIQWRQWSSPPQIEGLVTYVDASPHTEQKSVVGKAVMAGILAIIFAPLAFLPFVTKSEVSIRDMRIKDRHSGQPVSVRIRGDMIGSINMGDAVAVWLRTRRGVTEMDRAYNYTTAQQVKVKG